jgi:AcrR family transcriptional regulator
MTEVLAPDTRVSARRAVTRERLMVAASTVFAEHGIPGASVEEICEAAGFTRGAFYSNFADKDQLVLALIQASVQTQYAAAEQAIATMKTTTGDHSPADLVSIAITGFEEAARPGREGILTQQELLLYAARQPTLREPYLAFADECLRQLATLLADALRFTGLEFAIDFGVAIELLTATHNHLEMQALFTGQLDPDILRLLLLSITRPV